MPFQALMDTGASRTCVSAQCAQVAGLVPVGMAQMISATHTVSANTYLVDLTLQLGNEFVVRRTLPVVEFVQIPKASFQVLLGRDIICSGHFTVSFDGHFVFSLRTSLNKNW
ncbi:MAG: retroviral-like aspartic protease family protein [Candidatus Hydrogenedentes bacterium]|nr:retroviral-like aspartic protease family protein [Candidatus Hydrogenedentota bacterium]